MNPLSSRPPQKRATIRTTDLIVVMALWASIYAVFGGIWYLVDDVIVGAIVGLTYATGVALYLLAWEWEA